jgi:hypothetical protein
MTSSPATQQQQLLLLQEPAHSRLEQTMPGVTQHKQQQMQVQGPQAAALPQAQALAMMTSKPCMKHAWHACGHKQQAGNPLMMMMMMVAMTALGTVAGQGPLQGTVQQQQGQAAGQQHPTGSHSSWAAAAAVRSRCRC